MTGPVAVVPGEVERAVGSLRVRLLPLPTVANELLAERNLRAGLAATTPTAETPSRIAPGSDRGVRGLLSGDDVRRRQDPRSGISPGSGINGGGGGAGGGGNSGGGGGGGVIGGGGRGR